MFWQTCVSFSLAQKRLPCFFTTGGGVLALSRRQRRFVIVRCADRRAADRRAAGHGRIPRTRDGGDSFRAVDHQGRGAEVLTNSWSMTSQQGAFSAGPCAAGPRSISRQASSGRFPPARSQTSNYRQR